jgi:hypothetical protein
MVAGEGTRSSTSSGWNVRCPFGAPTSSGISAAVKLPSLSATASAPVSTASTPGAAFALVVSMRLIRACACGESSSAP